VELDRHSPITFAGSKTEKTFIKQSSSIHTHVTFYLHSFRHSVI